MLKNLLLVGLGGGLGAVLRWAGYEAFKNIPFPFATTLINIIGSFAIGWLLARGFHGKLEPSMRLFLVTGICGGFTTFSAFSAENLTLLQDGKITVAMLYILLSVAGGIGAAFLGFRMANF